MPDLGGARQTDQRWNEPATFLASLSDEDRAHVSSYGALGLPADVEGIAAVLSTHAA
ncbi:MAG: hypothetical protein M3272_02655 [Actinomycetota bacterium]|nr:hypothetical protein [Actinomycetota bacterium]